MANLGQTRLEAVNEILDAANLPAVAALDTGGGSEAGMAERFLDRASLSVQIRGWPCNTTFKKTYTPSMSGTITVASNVIAIRPNGVSANRKLHLRGDSVYDADLGSTDLGEDDVILDVVEELTFEQCAPDLKEKIVKEASQLFRRRVMPDQAFDAMQSQETAVSEVNAQRHAPRPAGPSPTMNERPFFPQPPSAPSGGDG